MTSGETNMLERWRQGCAHWRGTPAKMPKDLNISLLLDYYGQLLDDKQRDMLDLYYNEDFSLAEISENSEMTRQGVRDRIKRAENSLYNIEDKLALLKSDAIKKREFLKILDTIDDIRPLSNEREINEKLDSIRDIILQLIAG